jgi:hypothetical protein
MSVEALRHLMGLMQGELHQFIADSFYEVLLATPVHVAMRDGSVALVHGPGGQAAVPIFLDQAALFRWGGVGAPSKACSASDAAALAHAVGKAWLVVDFGSTPGTQPIATAGVEALLNRTYPGAERYNEQWGVVQELIRVIKQGHTLDREPELKRRVEDSRFYTLAAPDPSAPAPTPLPGSPANAPVFEMSSRAYLSVRGPEAESYLPVWPSPGGSFRYMPYAPGRQVMRLGLMARDALDDRRGLAFGVPEPYLAIPHVHLQRLWGT